MKKFACADSETDPFKFNRIPEPFLWGYFDGENYHEFSTTKQFVDFIREKEIIIYMHNGGKLDMHFLFGDVLPQEDIIIINGRVAKIKIGAAEIRDSYLLLPVPLATYKKDEIDYSKFELENRDENMAEISAYLKNDCIYLYEILAKNFELYGQKLTLASSAFDFWNKKFNPNKFKPKTGLHYFNHFKYFYFGGRVQCFQKGIINKEFKVFDINSAYPYAMLHDHPYGNEYLIYNSLPENKIESCFIHLRAISDGALPVRENNKLDFPSDNKERDYHCTGWELKTALENNKIRIIRIFRVYRFLNSINFAEYVDYFYKQKSELKNKDAARYLLAKLYLNSLYGKFGQSSQGHRNFELIDPQFIHGYIDEKYEFEGMIGEYALMSRPIDESEMNFYNVATAASITGFVRAFLFRHILTATEPLYCDTDAVAAVDFPCITGPGIGQWSKEGDFTKGAIAGKKMYAFRRKKMKDGELYKISSKGVKLSADDIFAIAEGEEICYKNHAPTFRIGKTPEFIERKIRMT